MLDLAVKLSGFPRNVVCDLDDVCATILAGSAALHTVHRFPDAYFSVSEQLGMRLTPDDDPDKAFAPRRSGVVLGVHWENLNLRIRVLRIRVLRIPGLLRRGF